MKRNRLPLPNLPIKQKLLFTALLLVGVICFLFSWLYVLNSVYTNGQLGEDSIGVALGVIAGEDYDSFVVMFLLHALSMTVLLGVSQLLFRQSSLRRRAKGFILLASVGLAALDLSAWGYAPSCSPTNMYVGVMGVVSAIPLLFIALIPLVQLWWYRRWRSADGKVKRVVVVGGGFAGLYAALGLHRVLGYSDDLEITVLDKNNYFLFPPLLPSAAVGTIETRQVCYPFRRIFETTNIIFRKVEVLSIDPKGRRITGKVEVNSDPASGTPVVTEAQFEYDYLVLAPGSLTQTFSTEGAAEHAFFMRELTDAIALRNQVIDCFERAAVLTDRASQTELLTFAVVGGGPTGIETATEIHDLIHSVLLKRYPEIDPTLPRVCIVQSGSQVLPGWPAGVVQTTTKQLQRMQIQLMLNCKVASVRSDRVVLGNGQEIHSRTVVWAAGVRPSELLTKCNLPLDRSGRVVVEQDCRVTGHPEIFVLGDAAFFVEKNGDNKPLPPLGQVAFQQGSHTAKNLVRLLSSGSTAPFRYFNFGGLVSVGEHFAAVNLLGVRLSGVVGWFVWRTLYLVKIVGFSNKVRIVLDWTLDLLIERSIAQLRTSRIAE